MLVLQLNLKDVQFSFWQKKEPITPQEVQTLQSYTQTATTSGGTDKACILK